MKTRTGKIARLPLDVRTELNRRIENGEPGNELVAWLNEQPEVECVLDAYFGGRAINEQNLSDWKAGGYQDWLAQRELQAEASQLTENAGELAASARVLPEHLVTVLAIRYAALLAEWDGAATDEFEGKLRSLDRLRQSVVALQRGHHRAIEVELKQRRYEDEWVSAERERRAEAATNAAAKEMMIRTEQEWNEKHPEDQHHYSFLQPKGLAGAECRMANDECGEEAPSIKANQGESSRAGERKKAEGKRKKGKGSRRATGKARPPRRGEGEGGQNIQQPTSNIEQPELGEKPNARSGGRKGKGGSIKANQGESSHRDTRDESKQPRADKRRGAADERLKAEGKSVKRGKTQHPPDAQPLGGVEEAVEQDFALQLSSNHQPPVEEPPTLSAEPPPIEPPKKVRVDAIVWPHWVSKWHRGLEG